MDPEVLSLIGDIYDASIDPELWTHALHRITDFIVGCSALLFVQDFVNQRGQFYFNWNDNPEFTRSFFDRYMKISPLSPHLMMTHEGEVFTASSLMPYEELRASRFFQEWCVPQGYTDLVGVTLERSAASVANISVGRDQSQGLMDDEAVRRMTLLAPHIRRAVLIGKVIELHKLEAAAMSDALDVLAAAMFLVGARGGVVYANAAGRAMLAEGAVVSDRRGTLALTDPEASASMAVALEAARGGDGAVATRGVAIPFSDTAGKQFVAHVMPLTSGARLAAGAAHAATAAVFVREAGLSLPTPIETVAKLHGLSSSEVRVLYAVLEVGGAAEMASMLGLSEATVRTHLQHLFAKTGTKRQADLVKLVAGFASPLTD